MISSEASGQNELPQDEGRQGRKTMPETDQSPHRLLISMCLVKRPAAFRSHQCPVDNSVSHVKSRVTREVKHYAVSNENKI